MAYRAKEWNESLAKEMKDPEFARAFFLAALDEGISLQQALAKVIRSYGVKEYGKKLGIASSNLLRLIDPKHNPTQKNLTFLLKPLGLKLSAAPIKSAA